jgi:hypothetical protein
MLPWEGELSCDGAGGEAVEQATVISVGKRSNVDSIDIRNLTSLQSRVAGRIN